MHAAAFETIARKCGFRPLSPRVTPHGRVLIAERRFTWSDMQASPGAKDGTYPVLAPHWCSMWVLDRGGLDVGQYVYHGTAVSRDVRVADALRSADEWVESNVRLRRFA